MSDEQQTEQATVRAASAPIYDDKAHVRGQLDLTDAQWQRAGDDEDDEGEIGRASCRERV